MITAIIDFIKRLLGLDTESSDVEWVKEKIKDNKKKIEDIEDENPTTDDIVDHFND
jgi:hypothetical protein